MADNIVIANKNVAFDEVTIDGQSVVVARDKVGFGSSGSYADVETTNPLPVADVNVGAAGDASSANTVIGLLKAVKAAIVTTATNFLAVRLTDGTSYLNTTAGRLQVSDGGVALSTAVSNFPATQPVSVAAAVSTKGAGTFGYAAGNAAGSVDVPAGARITRVSVLAGATVAGSVTILGGPTIPIAAGGAFDETISGDALATSSTSEVVVGGTVQAYYVAWAA